ncbi:MAG: Dabb family protein [Clostridia bacterium]|nr:Dabb family protein [Clostridia bacterium]
MVKHIIVWTLKEMSDEEKIKVKKGIKENLEALKGKIPGLFEITVHTEALPSSNADLILDSTFLDEASLKGYAIHPDHVYVADTFVRPNVQIRSCIDYEI